jgi:hypothetical protein
MVAVGGGAPAVGFNDDGLGGSGQTGVVGIGTMSGVSGIASGGTAGSFFGDVSVDGALTVTSCTGCTIASVAVNGSGRTLRRGDPVAVLGMRRSPVDSGPMLSVGPARPGRPVIGIVDTSAEVGLIESGVSLGGPGSPMVEARSWETGGTVVPAGGFLTVVTHGVAWARVDSGLRSVAPGEDLVAGPLGRLVARGPMRVGQMVVPDTSLGFAMQRASSGSGLVAVFVSPH